MFVILESLNMSVISVFIAVQAYMPKNFSVKLLCWQIKLKNSVAC